MIMLQKYARELQEKGKVGLKVRVRTGAAKTALTGILDDATIKIDLKSPAQDGRANTELINFVQKKLGARELRIISGVSSKTKVLIAKL
jgi:uncharacterized protein (TIGR00251 family)